MVYEKWLHVYKKMCMDMALMHQVYSEKTTTMIPLEPSSSSRHDLLTITADTVIRFATVILSDPAYCRAITLLLNLIGFDAHFFVSAQLMDSYYQYINYSISLLIRLFRQICDINMFVNKIFLCFQH